MRLKSPRVGISPVTCHRSRAYVRFRDMVEDFRNAEHRLRQTVNEIKPVCIFRDTERETRRAGVDVGADKHRAGVLQDDSSPMP